MELSYESAWIIPLCPLITSGVIGSGSFFFARATRSLRCFCATISVLSLAVSMFVSIILFWQQVITHSRHEYLWLWLSNNSISLGVGLLVDSLSLIMSVLVTTVGTSVMIYSSSYMCHDRGYIRFFAYLNLFTASMLGLVFSPNLIQIYVFRELVGMCSYLLVGFWFTRPSAANACQKAFVTNRIGDFGLLLGILGTYWITGSFEIHELCDQFSILTNNGQMSSPFANICAIFLLLGPMAKSAQFPLHVWLPDAMEGPTPVSALIHAATMVAAGIFFVVRMNRFFDNLPLSSNVIRWVGGITILSGAIIAIGQNDIKKSLAYSTISQLGYMMLALGIGAYRLALFHLITHAYSKALLFLGSGSVIHSMEKLVGYSPNKNQNMFVMGGLREYMPITGITFLLGTLSPSGVPPLSCFWSKEEIITESWAYSSYLGIITSFAAGLTGFYMFRIYFLTFEGTFRLSDTSNSLPDPLFLWGNTQSMDFSQKQNDRFSLYVEEGRSDAVSDQENSSSSSSDVFHSSKSLYPKESDTWMLLPIVTLSVPTLLIGYLGIQNPRQGASIDLLSDWLSAIVPYSSEIEQGFNSYLFVKLLSLILSLSGAFASYKIYGFKSSYRPERNHDNKNLQIMMKNLLPLLINSIQTFSRNEGYINQIYDIVFIRSIRYISSLISFFDQWIIDGIINALGIGGLLAGEAVKYVEGGRISFYLFGLIVGITSLLIFFVSRNVYEINFHN
uniref:NAD(P)H-quinone oxidoreductase subunit 5, chloroplastic n=1 Tax=Lygodium microphyllum TaxID=148566 RepID=A0A345HHN6_9MONI|nr:NADH-plastoquinone oxidoreductase subunit 5 [Lygodium microphyllum]AXG76126.1 NADH-plastoquinone oxidoreductase subunit 5 [Lygodium microphyllum]